MGGRMTQARKQKTYHDGYKDGYKSGIENCKRFLESEVAQLFIDQDEEQAGIVRDLAAGLAYSIERFLEKRKNDD